DADSEGGPGEAFPVEEKRDQAVRGEEEARRQGKRDDDLILDRLQERWTNRGGTPQDIAGKYRVRRHADGGGDEPQRLGQHVRHVEQRYLGRRRERLQHQDPDAPVEDDSQHRQSEWNSLKHQPPDAGPLRRESGPVHAPREDPRSHAEPDREGRRSRREKGDERSAERGARGDSRDPADLADQEEQRLQILPLVGPEDPDRYILAEVHQGSGQNDRQKGRAQRVEDRPREGSSDEEKSPGHRGLDADRVAQEPWAIGAIAGDLPCDDGSHAQVAHARDQWNERVVERVIAVAARPQEIAEEDHPAHVDQGAQDLSRKAERYVPPDQRRRLDVAAR